jgi:hypothetical protein
MYQCRMLEGSMRRFVLDIAFSSPTRSQYKQTNKQTNKKERKKETKKKERKKERKKEINFRT